MPLKNREVLEEGYQVAFGVSAEQAAGQVDIVEGRARVWAKQTGRSADDYIGAHYASLGKAVEGAPIDDAALRQAGFVKRKPAYPWKTATFNYGERRHDDALAIAKERGLLC